MFSKDSNETSSVLLPDVNLCTDNMVNISQLQLLKSNRHKATSNHWQPVISEKISKDRLNEYERSETVEISDVDLKNRTIFQ